ncbi:hypothetical protein KCM76_25280 [Zooshikella marina]|uniref:hypothetical protein n=1 Tax=Zooshikella ganghwensis TaxID=202772 RepID=UPI001BAF37BE|nr:hypothetical protein [Zooshikella ganghwensis]MBU2709333.1 hypothetical protein [Zooshikella ganghwensis]
MDKYDGLSNLYLTVGKILVYFATIEQAMYETYKVVCPERDYNDDSFDKRFNKLIGYFDGNSSYESIFELLIMVKSNLDYRHLIAHNPFTFDIYINEESSDQCIQLTFTNRKDNTNITLDELQRFAEKLEILAYELPKKLHEFKNSQ